MIHRISLLLFTSLFTTLALCSIDDCTLFTTNGSASAHFSYYRFYDFRNFTDAQSIAASTGSEDSVLETSKVTSNGSWTDDWQVRVWQREAANSRSIPLQYAAENVYYSNSSNSSSNSYLTFSTTRLANNSQQAGAITYTEQNVTYLSLRVLARVRGDSGAVAGFFTYFNDTQESDIEILTREQDNRVQYTNQPGLDNRDNEIEGASFNLTMASPLTWSDWLVHRLDWTPGYSAWYLNGVQMASTKVHVPSVASAVILNMWSNGGSFSGRMKTGAEAWLDVQWIEMAYNTSTQTSASSEGQQSVLCSVEKEVGSPSQTSASSTLVNVTWRLLVGLATGTVLVFLV